MLTIGELARELGGSIDTLKRWEQRGKIPKARRSPGGWRFYSCEDLQGLRDLIAAPTGIRSEVAEVLDDAETTSERK